VTFFKSDPRHLFLQCTLVSSTNKTDRQETEILLKVALNTITLTQTWTHLFHFNSISHYFVYYNHGEQTQIEFSTAQDVPEENHRLAASH
jgi:hypothetical protein